MQILIQVTVPVFLIIGAGYLSVRFRVLTDDNIHGLMNFAQRVAIPCLLFRAISQLDFETNFDLQFMASFYAGSLCSFFLGLVGARYIFKRSIEDSIAIGFTALFGNTVLIGLAIVERAHGGGALDGTFLLIAFHAPFCYLIGITAMEIAKGGTARVAQACAAVISGMFRNAIMLGILAGLILNFLDISVHGLVGDAVDALKLTALPAALFGLGGILVRYRPEGDIKIIAMVCVLALLVHPTATWLLAVRTFGLELDLVRSSVITAAMAPGINAYIFASMYERARRVAASSVLVGTALSIITVSAWLLVVG